MKYKIRVFLTGIIFVGFLSAPAFAAGSGGTATEEDADIPDYMKCGAAGDGCQPPEWQEYFNAAWNAFDRDNWPTVGYRRYAGACMKASAKIKKLCKTNPRKAAKILDIWSD